MPKRFESQEKFSKTQSKKRHQACAKDFTKKLISKSPYFKALLNKLLDFCITYKNLKVSPSQIFLAERLGCTERWVNHLTGVFHKLGFINKKDRGWDIVHVESGTFIKKTCEYTFTRNLSSKIKFIYKNLPKGDPLWSELYKSIPAIGRFIRQYFLVSFIYLNTGYLINNNNSIQSKELTIFGQNDYEISKKYEKEEIFPTSTLSVPQYHMPVDHPFNTYEEHYPYNKYNIQSRVKLMIKDKMMNNIDLRFCSDSDYKKLDHEDQKIASNYCNGKKLYGSIQLYENSLHKRNLSSKIWKPRFPIVNMAADKLKLIQKFPEVVKQDCRYILKKFPNEAKNYNWILDYGLTRCKMRNLSTREILKKNGFQDIRIKPEDNIKPKATQINDNFRRLIGDEAFNAYMNKINPLNKEKDI